MEIRSFPYACKDCPGHERKFWGCGYDGFAGQAEIKPKFGATDEHWGRTCPQYCAHQIEIQKILADVEDYQRGCFGNIDDMESARLEYLRVAESETKAWKAENERQILGN